MTSERVLQGQRKAWKITALSANKAFMQDANLSSLEAHLLERIGLNSVSETRLFLGVGFELFEDPWNLPEIDLAINRLEQARKNEELVAVFGDFDADGVTGTALMVRALERYGLNTIAYIPHRAHEGHGLNHGAIDYLSSRNISLIITVDCGVTDVSAIAYARDRGIDSIVTDHHLVAKERPNAIAIINPHAPMSNYPFLHLTGVGMALKFAQALLSDENPADWADGLMELAAIGTVTDMAPLIGENRYIVAKGIEHLRNTANLGLQTLLQSARVTPRHATAETIGFVIGPRLNAAGRLGHANTAYKLLMTSDPIEATSLVAQLQATNTLRQELTEATLKESKALMDVINPETRVIMVGSEKFNIGVVGLVAGKLVQEYGLPSVVYSINDDSVTASCRSAPGFHWTEALSSCADLLDRYGGHAQAAGFTCPLMNISELNTRLNAVASERLSGSIGPSEGRVDADVELSMLMGGTFQSLKAMEPFGIGNPQPVFLTRGVYIANVKLMGKEQEHFRATLKSEGAIWDAVAFRQTWLDGTVKADIIYTINTDYWDGKERIRLNLLDYSPV